jgi:hypothetical protein
VSRIVENTQKEETSLSFRSDTLSESSGLINQMLVQGTQAFRVTNILDILNGCSERTGNYIQLLPELGFCPALIDSDNNSIFLYEFVETLDELIDYDAIREEYPGLSFAQIDGAISFLREIAKFNVYNVDLDEFEHEEMVNDQEFLNALRQGLADREVSRMLDFHE